MSPDELRKRIEDAMQSRPTMPDAAMVASLARKLTDARAALRANLSCDECDELATRTHAATARFGCDAHGVGEGWSDTTHAAAVRASVER